MNPIAAGLALILDMDGVMIDSNRDHSAAWVEFNRRHGIETTTDMLRRMYGKRNDEIVRDYYGDHLTLAEIDRRGAAKEQLYRDRIDGRLEELLVPGIREFLEEYREAPLAVATNAEPANADFVLNRGGLRPFFRVVVDGHQVGKPKPDPEVYLRAAALLGVPPGNCIVFEDSESGVAAALAAGMRVIGVCTTHGNLPGTSITVDNFLGRSLRSWLQAQVSVV